MIRKMTLVLSVAGLLAASPLTAVAQEDDRIPPENALKASEIIARVEARDDLRYLDEVDWDDDGFYEIVYYTMDKARVELKINPLTGEPM
jgi:hypothetical protein